MKGKSDGGAASDNAGGNPTRAARWSDPKVAAQALLSGLAPPLAEALEAGQQATNIDVDAAEGALESDAKSDQKGPAARWSDPRVCAQALLDNSTRWKGLFVSNQIPPLDGAGGEPLDQLEREYVRGGDPHFPGRFSTAPGPGGATKSPPGTRAAATPAAGAPTPTRGDAAGASRTTGTPSSGGTPLLAQNTPQRLPPPDKPERLPPALPVSPTSPANPRLSRDEQLDAAWKQELQRAQGQNGPPASDAKALEAFLEGAAKTYGRQAVANWLAKHRELWPQLPGYKPPANSRPGRLPRKIRVEPSAHATIQNGHPTGGVGIKVTFEW